MLFQCGDVMKKFLPQESNPILTFLHKIGGMLEGREKMTNTNNYGDEQWYPQLPEGYTGGAQGMQQGMDGWMPGAGMPSYGMDEYMTGMAMPEFNVNYGGYTAQRPGFPGGGFPGGGFPGGGF